MKYKKRFTKVMVSLAVIVALLGSATKVNAASSGSKTINSTYGKLKGETFGGMYTTGKYFESDAATTKKVPRIYADIEIQYYQTGKTIAKDMSGWKSNSKLAATYVYMDKFKNALKNNKKDGFVNTKCTAYGCAEAIVKKAYTVYTSKVY